MFVANVAWGVCATIVYRSGRRNFEEETRRGCHEVNSNRWKRDLARIICALSLLASGIWAFNGWMFFLSGRGGAVAVGASLADAAISVVCSVLLRSGF
jgi:hypothetical protein